MLFRKRPGCFGWMLGLVTSDTVLRRSPQLRQPGFAWLWLESSSPWAPRLNEPGVTKPQVLAPHQAVQFDSLTSKSVLRLRQTVHLLQVLTRKCSGSNKENVQGCEGLGVGDGAWGSRHFPLVFFNSRSQSK